MFMPNAICSDTNTRSNPQPSSNCAQSVRCSQLAGASAENEGIPIESCIEAIPYVNRSAPDGLRARRLAGGQLETLQPANQDAGQPLADVARLEPRGALQQHP